MLSWLIAAEAFRLAYPAARRGRKVAYLTLAGFVFLVLTLATFAQHENMTGNAHGNEGDSAPQIQNPKSKIQNRPGAEATHSETAAPGGAP
jgi:hypothetical protein